MNGGAIYESCFWHYYGYGICVDDIKTQDVCRLQKLLAEAPDFHETIALWLEESDVTEPTWDDYMNYDQDNYLGLATLLKEVIREAEILGLVACDDYNGKTYVIYTPGYPWNIPDEEQDLTEERLDAIFKHYVGILTDEPVSVDHQEVENGAG